MISETEGGAVPPRIRLTRPDATREERRIARQARVGILRNLAKPDPPPPAPQDFWRRWPRLRSRRRAGQSPGTTPSS